MVTIPPINMVKLGMVYGIVLPTLLTVQHGDAILYIVHFYTNFIWYITSYIFLIL